MPDFSHVLKVLLKKNDLSLTLGHQPKQQSIPYPGVGINYKSLKL